MDLWTALGARLDLLPVALVRVEQGIVGDRLGLARLAAAGPDERRVMVMGNSRAQDGFFFSPLPRELELVKVTHAPISPLEVRLFAPEAAAYEPDVFVVMLSELDTHRPVRIVPRSGFGSLAGVLDLVRAAGPRFALENRVKLERLSVASLLHTYRFRDVLDRAWLDERCSFAPDKRGRFPGLVSHDLEEAPEPPPAIEGLDALVERFQESGRRRVVPSTLNLIHAIRPGDHAALEQHLIEGALEILRSAGCEVLIVEAPLHPVSYELYDRAATRPEFLAFVERLRSELGVHFLPLEESGPFEADDFEDPLHLRPARGRELGALTLERIEAILGLEFSGEAETPSGGGKRTERKWQKQVEPRRKPGKR